MSSSVRFERVAEHVVVVTLNRPEACNAVDAELTQTLGKLAKQVEEDPSIRVAILMGAGERAFCAGADLKTVAAGGVSALSTEEGGFAGFARLPRRKVWLAAVHASVLAGGLELMLACDFAIAAQGSVFGLPEVRRGLVATEGGLYRLPRAIPRGLALQMIATGMPICAQEALMHGLITKVVEPSRLREEALAIASTIADNSPLAVHESLAIARDANTQDEQTLARRSGEVLGRLKDTHDFREGSQAFVERRAPRWRGA